MRQLTPGLISSLPGMTGLPLFISFSTRCAEFGSGALLSSDGSIVFLAPEEFLALTGSINIPGELAMSEVKYAAYEALGPFFEIVMKGLRGVVDGDHYFDTIAEDDAASYVTPVVAGSIAAVFGSNLAIGQASSVMPTPLPTT